LRLAAILAFKGDARRADAQKQQAERGEPGGIEKIHHANMMREIRKSASPKLTYG
jgi:hypothetical protein